jgi:3' terminal RNA ribose 2'-O-methyltransferase Hen1
MTLLGPLHEERLSAVLYTALASGADSIMDLGCGSGAFLSRLIRETQFTRILGMDVSAVALEVARQQLLDGRCDGPDRLLLVHGSYTQPDRRLQDYRVATLIETIEHLPPGRLSQLEHTVFAGYRPERVIVTTPNVEYNVLLGLAPGERRDPDHQFEWSRAKFREWAFGVARRCRFGLTVRGIGEPDAQLGAPSQMAVFDRIEASA